MAFSLDFNLIETQILKTFDFISSGQLIEFETDEFSAVCPFSGLPDIAKLEVKYYPEGGLCVELKSFKLYMVSFRNVGIYQEEVTRRIYIDLNEALKTSRLMVRTTYNTRGGIKTVCTEGAV